MIYTSNITLKLDSKQKQYIEELKSTIKSSMNSELYIHSVSTLDYALKLAGIYFLQNTTKGKNSRPDLINNIESSDLKNINKWLFRLSVSSILHDYGKIFSSKELLEIAKNKELGLSEFEINCEPLLHGFLGPYLIQRDFNIKDLAILNAIKCHTIGSCNMSLLDKILYISDKIGEDRNYEDIERYRKLSLQNINLCLLEVYKSNIIYVITKHNFLHPDTSKIWNYICGGF
jgi:predicted HD superfamily hydrolase involved in NAD metabolism